MARSLCGGSSAGGSYDAVWGHGGTGRRDVVAGSRLGDGRSQREEEGRATFRGQVVGAVPGRQVRVGTYGLRTHPMIPCNLPK